MSEERSGLNPVLKRGLIMGIILGVILGVVVIMLVSSHWILMAFLPVVGIVSYKYVGNSLSGIALGLTTYIICEFTSSVLRGTVPFSELQYLRWPGVAEQVLIAYVIGFGGFPAVGYVSGRICERRGISRILTSEIYLTDLEREVLSYIQSHNNQIQITDCALELGTDSKSVKKALKALEKKGRLET